MYVRFFLFSLYGVVAVCVGYASPSFISSGNPLKPPRRGGKGGALIGASATHRSTRPHTERPEHQREGQRKNCRSTREKGRTHWERAESKPPTHIVAGGTSFLRKRAVLARGEDCVQAVQGSRPQRSIAERIERVFSGGVVGGAYRYMAMSQYSVLWGCICSLSTAIALAYVSAWVVSNPPPPP